jgi:hypothetical protein
LINSTEENSVEINFQDKLVFLGYRGQAEDLNPKETARKLLFN